MGQISTDMWIKQPDESWQKNYDGNNAAEFERLLCLVRLYCCSQRRF